LVRTCDGKVAPAAFVAGPGLLQNMGKFVRQKPVSRGSARRMLPWREDNVVADSVSPRMDGFGRFCSFRVIVDPYRTEIPSEPRLKKGATARVQRPPSGRNRLADTGRRHLRACADAFPPQYRLVLRLTGRATAQDGLVAQITVMIKRKPNVRIGARRG